MRVHVSGLLLSSAALFGTGYAAADVEADLDDLGSRAAYGFFAQEPDVIAAARAALEQLSDSDPRVSYQRALAALRDAQLDLANGRSPESSVEDCIDAADDAAEQKPEWAEPWVLIAACSALGASRRFEQAMSRARALDADNPRLPLVAAWRQYDEMGRLESDAAGEVVARLEQALPLFAARSRELDAADWGEAETLVLLGELYLRRGDVRSARDVIEQALLVAPGYTRALELKSDLERHVVGAR